MVIVNLLAMTNELSATTHIDASLDIVSTTRVKLNAARNTRGTNTGGG